jgi:D-sedoheptulose 7-phosphate isomerase
MTFEKYIRDCIQKSIGIKKELLYRAKKIEEIADKIVECYKNGNKLLIFGNGGSAGDSQHIAAEFVNKFKMERKALPAIALTTDTSAMSAIGNDSSFDYVFSRQVEALAKKYDILFGISTSGKSKNVIEAFNSGKKIGTYNISLTGRGGGRLKELSDICFDIPALDTPRIQEAHELVYHVVCDLVEQKLFGGENK